MAFPSTSAGVDVTLPGEDAVSAMFAEELALILEVAPEHEAEVLAAYAAAGVKATAAGVVTADGAAKVVAGGSVEIAAPVSDLRDSW